VFLNRTLLAISILVLLAACSGTGPKSPIDGQGTVPQPVIEPESYIVEPLILASEAESALLSGAEVLQTDVDTKLVQPANSRAQVIFVWQVPNQKLDNFDGVKAKVFIDNITSKLQTRLRQDASFAYSLSIGVKHWPESVAKKLLVVVVASKAESLPELQAIMLDELYIQREVGLGSSPDEQFVNAWLGVFLDRSVGYRARLQQLPSI